MSTTEPDQLRPAVEELARDASSRKRFLRSLGGGAAATAFTAFLAACGDDDKGSGGGMASQTQSKPTTTQMSGGGDLEIVNYALTLEYLEADFYQQVIESGVIKDKKAAALAQRIGENEQAHVEALTTAAKSLGKPADKPKTNFDDVLAGGPEKILATAATVENLGAAAYLGQAARIQDKKILAAALSIHSVEARHAAALNELAGRDFQGSGPLEGSIPDGAFGKPLTMDQVLEQVKPFLAG